MSDDHQTPSPEQRTTIRAADHKVIYSDFFSVKPSSVDISITFGNQTLLPLFNPQTGTSITISAMMEHVTVAMPLPILKALSLNLTQIIKVIESELGTIRITRMSIPSEQNLELVRQAVRNNPLIEASDQDTVPLSLGHQTPD
jgi:hypothetical protein